MLIPGKTCSHGVYSVRDTILIGFCSPVKFPIYAQPKTYSLILRCIVKLQYWPPSQREETRAVLEIRKNDIRASKERPKWNQLIPAGIFIFYLASTEVILELTSPQELFQWTVLNFATASQQPGLVSVTLTSQHGICLGKTHIKYYGRKEVLNTIVRSPILVKEICEEYSMVYGFGETNMEAINSGILGKLNLVNSFSVLGISWRWEKLLRVTV